jgi:hypothetical protein
MSELADVSDVSAEEAVEAFETAHDENQMDPFREGQIIRLAGEGELWITGDLHDHRTNFRKLVQAADLPNNPRRHLLLHELIHGSYVDETGAEDSWKMLYQAACLKADYPEQVHFILANHDLAQIHGEGIMKGGVGVCEAFTKALKRDFGSGRGLVDSALTQFYVGLPLAVSTPGGLLITHSLPSDEQIDAFDFTVFDRPRLTGPDYKRKIGPAYQLIWGRGMGDDTAAKFADHMNAKIVITGHQPQEFGYFVNADRHLILASDHNQGVFLPVDLQGDYDMASLTSRIKRFLRVDPEDPSTFAA